MIKCIGCSQLKRVEIIKKGLVGVVVYDCPELPYMCALSGLLGPSKRIGEAAAQCGFDASNCAVCGRKAYHHYGGPFIAHACKRHGAAWGLWLDKHDPDRQRLAPKGRPRQSAWIEFFREFVEEARTVKNNQEEKNSETSDLRNPGACPGIQ